MRFAFGLAALLQKPNERQRVRIIFLFSRSIIFGESQPEEEVRLARKVHDTAIYSLAAPSIAWPSAMLAAVPALLVE